MAGNHPRSKGSRVAISRTAPDAFSQGEGRCSAEGGFIGFRRAAFDTCPPLEAVLFDEDGNETRRAITPHRRSVTSIQVFAKEHGLTWDGTVADDVGVTHYMDEATVRGNYPKDCPPALRKRIGRLAAAATDKRDMHELRLEMALAARERGYAITDAELTRIRDKSRTYVERHPVRDGFAIRPLTSIDHRAIAALFSSSDRPYLTWEDTKQDQDQLVQRITRGLAAGAPFVGYFDHAGKLQAIDGIVPAEGDEPATPLTHASGYTWDVRSRYSIIGPNLLREELREFSRAHLGETRCFSCSTPRSLCSCDRRAGALLYEIRVAAAESIDKSEHQWSSTHKVAPTPAMRAAASAAAAAVRQAITTADPKAAAAIDQVTAGSGFESIALFLEQTGISPTEREKLLTDPVTAEAIAQLMVRTTARADAIHSDYVRTLYAEFDTPGAPLADRGINEQYLGRDGIYMLYAREEMRRAYQQRNDARADAHTVQYLSVSRNAAWEPRHHSKLGQRPVMIDTGWHGSIPTRIANDQGLALRSTPGFVPQPGEAAVRMLYSYTPGYMFQWRANWQHDVEAIEGDAKTTTTARYVGDKAPAGALEQLVHRQLELCIRRTAQDQITRILQAEQTGSVDLEAAGLGTSRFYDSSGKAAFWTHLEADA